MQIQATMQMDLKFKKKVEPYKHLCYTDSPLVQRCQRKRIWSSKLLLGSQSWLVCFLDQKKNMKMYEIYQKPFLDSTSKGYPNNCHENCFEVVKIEIYIDIKFTTQI